MSFCPKCGTQNHETAVNCANCGEMLASSQSMPVQQQIPGNGLAIASMVCGIVSFFCFGIVLGVLAVIFGAVAKNKGYKGGMATAGIVLGVIGLAIYLVLLFTAGSLIPFTNM